MASRTPTPLTHPDIDDIDLLTVLSALADPVRLGIVVKLVGRPGLTCGGFYPDVTASVLTRHFRVLREAGVIRQEDSGVRRENTLRKADLDARFPGLIDIIVKEAADGAIPRLPH
ncbi:ArsR/SmtB family transcription factor [Actinoplanes couchii]|uniref:Transcriptional regulator n=1 Tax=Actinoplanes couchii TaxID=403638 RepID=A0ABQ3XLI9_9ACTN|nr:helix-turn-helix domain-containing protein [Actinoplanes couchii]MDR6318263.1 DNA-binding transcriptional ArsR family regulator [Actinoplanes couchii]GID59367.1 transcriptional regulator [Actinoplanes couchii]